MRAACVRTSVFLTTAWRLKNWQNPEEGTGARVSAAARTLSEKDASPSAQKTNGRRSSDAATPSNEEDLQLNLYTHISNT